MTTRLHNTHTMKLERITFRDYPKLLHFFKRQHYRLCVYSLPSLIAWSTREYQPYAAVSGDMLIVGEKFVSNKHIRHLVLPISEKQTPAPEKLYELAERSGFQQYWYVPEDYIDTCDQDRLASLFEISRQKEYDDYVYRASDLAYLKGNKYSKKRNLINQFKRDYLDKGRVEVIKMTASVASECIDFLDRWCEHRDCDYDQEMELACEKNAAINMIEHIDEVDALGLMVRVDGAVSAFGVGCRLTSEMGVLHFEKAFSHIKGLYQYFDNLCATRIFDGYRYINKESDMANPGLARAKKSYHPVTMVRSYKLVLR